MPPSEPAAEPTPPRDDGPDANADLANAAASRPSLLLSYLRLGRVPNVFTAMADVTMGYFFTHPRLDPWPAWLWLVMASSFLYIAGMVLNDVFDVEIDRRERPQRPLPSGQITVGWARGLGFALLAIGVVCGAIAGGVPESGAAYAWRPSAVSIALAAAVLLYDGGLKKTPLGPFGMGLCRFLNVLLGMSLARSANGPSFAAYYEPAQLLAAAGIGLYIVGVTWFARSEAEDSSRGMLSLALAVMAGGIGLLAIFPEQLPPEALLFRSAHLWPALLLLLFAPLARGALFAISDPRPERVQGVIRHAIMSLILFDAAIVMALRGAYPLMKLRVSLLGGEYDVEHPDERAFRIAANDAFQRGLEQGGKVLLEPIMKLAILTPDDYVGDFVGDLQQRRANIVATENRGRMTSIEAHAPLKELFGYSNAMRSLSQGRAGCSMEPLEYAPAPAEMLKEFAL